MTYPYGTRDLDPLATAPRYTTVADVREVLGIPASDTSKDARITEAIVAIEWAIDAELGGGFEAGSVPVAVSSVARAAAVGVYQSATAPFGSAGSDDWLGTVSVPQIVSEQVRRNPQLMGLKVSFGTRKEPEA
jgi:hypothetical protein